MTREAIRSILVVGDGIVGLSAALAFSRALPWVEIKLLRMPIGAESIADHFPAMLPTVGRFHAAIGFDEIDLIRRDVAVHHLGTRFDDGAGGGWTHSFGDVGRGEGMVPFHQIWLGAMKDGKARNFDAYSPASVFGGAGKFVHPSGDPQSPLATYVYGLRVNPGRYRASLEAATAGIERIDGTVAGIERRADGSVANLTLDDGRGLAADLFVDCSGPAAVVIGAMGAAFEDWSQSFPAHHVDATWSDPMPLEPIDRVTSFDGGWRLTATVPGATLQAIVTTQPTASSTAIRPGRRRESFVGNVLAIGGSAVALDPLHGANLSLAHSAILRAIALLPGRNCHPLELAEYVRLTMLETDRARDFHALFQMHLHGVVAPGETLARTLMQWRARGRLPFFEEELFTPSSWMQMLVGSGILPDDVAPTARSVDPAAANDAMVNFAQELATLAARLPAYPDYLDRIKQPR